MEPVRRRIRGAALRLFGWLLVPELMVPALCALLVTPNARRMLVLAVGVGVLGLLFVSPWLPEGILPLRGRWMRRMLAGLALLAIAYATPRAGLQRVVSYNWDLRQVQLRLEKVAVAHPRVRPLGWVVAFPLPPPVGTLPVTTLLLAGALVGAVQFRIVWDDLGSPEERSRRGERVD